MANVLVNDIKLFFKNNVKIIVLVSILASVVYTGHQLFFNEDQPRNSEQDLISVEEGEIKTALAEFYIENPDGTTFTNTTLLKDFFLLPNNLEELEEETDVRLDKLIEADVLSSEEEFVTIYRNTGSNKISFFVQLGNEEDNLNVLNFYYDLIAEDEINFLENRSFYSLIPPKLIEEDDETEEIDKSDSLKVSAIISNAVFGFSLGLIGITLFLLFYEIINNKMKYTFSYNRDEKDLFMVYDENLYNIAEIENLVIHPISARKLFVTEKDSELVNKLFNKILREEVSTENVKYEIVNDISQVKPELDFDEIIFIINAASTNLKWYKKQRSLAKNYISRNKLVHIISQSK